MDEATLAGLRAAIERYDPVPGRVREAALAAFGWRDIDAELAELAYDSALDERALAGVRGATGPRLVTFSGAGLTVDVEVSEDGRRRRLVGQLVPPFPGGVHVHHAGETASTVADELGRFLLDGITAGPVRITCEGAPGARQVDTEWITL